MEQIIEWLIHDYLAGLLDSLVSPTKRVSVVYLLSAITIMIIWFAVLSINKTEKKFSLNVIKFFSPRIWLSKSARADYGLLLINRLVIALATPVFVSKIFVTTLLFYFFQKHLGSMSAILSESPVIVATVSYTIFLFILDDFSRYITHRALHQIPILWAFHKVHHTAEHLTPFTVFRTHPVEAWIFSIRSALVQGVAISIFVFLFGSKIDLLSIYGVNIFLFIFNLAGANLRHSNVPLSYGRCFEKIFISPAQHQIHHSKAKEHENKNYGVVLATWDLLGNSLCLSKADQILNYGVSGVMKNRIHSLTYLYFNPIKEAILGVSYSTRFLLYPIRNLLRTIVSFIAPRFAKMLVLIILAVGTFFPSDARSQEINIYSHRQPFLINPFIKAFEDATGIKSNIVFSSKGLAQRMLAEGKRSPADVVLTVDISRLHVYADKNLLSPVSSDILFKNIPSHLRDAENRWFGLSKRARIVAVSSKRVNLDKLRRIEDLALPSWKGKICSRPGSHVYNRALLASIIAAHGPEKATNWARGLVSNLAQRPQGNDRAQVKAIFQGVCDVAIINSYYFGKLRNSSVPEQREWTRDIKIVFTNQNDRGNHINISGGGVARYSKNKKLAVKFLEFLSGEKAQKLYTQVNFEFPSNPIVEYSDELRSWGAFKEDKLPIGVIAKLAPRAQMIIDQVGW